MFFSPSIRENSAVTDLALVPAGIEKGRGAELSVSAPIFLSSHIDRFWSIYRFASRTVTEFDPEKGSFWEPPRECHGYKSVPELERKSFEAQNEFLWNLLASGMIDTKILSLLTLPFYGGKRKDILVIGEEGNGVLALWVLMMRYRKCNDTYKRSLKKGLIRLVSCLQSSSLRCSIGGRRSGSSLAGVYHPRNPNPMGFDGPRGDTYPKASRLFGLRSPPFERWPKSG